MAAEPVLVEAAARLDPPRLRRVIAHLCLVADPDAADRDRRVAAGRRGLWLAPTWDGMVAIDGLLEPEAGQTLTAALEPLARPADAQDTRSGGQRRADALTELARRSLEGGRLPQTGGVRPQLTVTVDLDSLLGRPGRRFGARSAGPDRWTPEACQRLACDGVLTRVLVTRQQPAQSPPRPRPSASTTATPTATRAWRTGCGRRAAPVPRSLGCVRPSRWRWVGPAGSLGPPNGPPWRCVMVAVCSLAVRGRGLV